MQKVVSFVLIAICLGSVRASEDANGVDDWNVDGVAKFFKEQRLTIDKEKLQASEIDDGHDLMSCDKEDLESLGLTKPQVEKVMEAIEAKKQSIEKTPKDVFEWRVANLRLTDFWILPLLNLSPRASLIWARYFDKSHAIEKINDEIDEIPEVDFWMKWVLIPSLPLYEISKKFNSHTLTDEILEYAFLAKAVVEAFDIIINLLHFQVWKWLRIRVLELGGAFAAAAFAYHGLYWIVPKAVATVVVHFHVYFCLPLFCVLMMYGVRLSLFKAVESKSKTL